MADELKVRRRVGYNAGSKARFHVGYKTGAAVGLPLGAGLLALGDSWVPVLVVAALVFLDAVWTEYRWRRGR